MCPARFCAGAVASKLLQQKEETEEERDKREGTFQRLFGIHQPAAAVFRNAYPGTSLLPHTALSCKDQPGFIKTDGKPNDPHDPHGVFDTLIDRLCYEQLRPPGLLYLPRCPQAPDCDPGRAEGFGGFYTISDGGYQKRSIPQRLLTRVGINRKRMAAEDSLLYAPMVLSEAWWSKDENNKSAIERAVFYGTVEVEDDLSDQLVSALQSVEHLGSGSARGLGQVEVQAELESANGNNLFEKHQQNITQRVNQMNTTLQERWEELRPLCDDSADCPQIFTLKLHSDTILKEKGWLPTMVLTADMLREMVGDNALDAKLLRSYASYDYRGGWNTGQRLPKDTELVTRMGSVFVFATTQRDSWLKHLAVLEQKGIGQRTAEGFGEVVVCDAFHVEGRQTK